MLKCIWCLSFSTYYAIKSYTSKMNEISGSSHSQWVAYRKKINARSWIKSLSSLFIFHHFYSLFPSLRMHINTLLDSVYISIYPFLCSLLSFNYAWKLLSMFHVSTICSNSTVMAPIFVSKLFFSFFHSFFHYVCAGTTSTTS